MQKIKSMSLKALGLLYGLYGLFLFVSLVSLIKGGYYPELDTVNSWVKLIVGISRGLLILVVALFCWKQKPIAARLAWIAVAVFAVGGAYDVLFLHGHNFYRHLMTTYYVVVIAESLIAFVLTGIFKRDSAQ